ncbi:hypothetical protein LC613_03475 [Nostoc sphaeroides CHAB 2801]|nr:hypothetical protein [Nostoc sphaeroides]MCC5627274.1 hypothetical protein [Nostoc sphaeroides CHAB 2801]
MFQSWFSVSDRLTFKTVATNLPGREQLDFQYIYTLASCDRNSDNLSTLI